jgi:hypothetical protein
MAFTMLRFSTMSLDAEDRLAFQCKGGANINFGNDAFIRFSSYPILPSPDPNSQFIGADVEGFDRFFKNGRTAQYSLNVERELPQKFVLSAGYIGSKGTRLRSGFSPVNALPLNALKLGAPFLQMQLADVNAAQRSYAQSVGVTLPETTMPCFLDSTAQWPNR